MSFAVVEPWVEAPLHRFVDDARVLLALLLHPSGQVMGQHGFTRAVDVMSACALAAAIHASASALGEQLDGKPFAALHHAGSQRQVFIADAHTPRGRFVFLTVFDRESSLGLVSLYFDEFRQALAQAAPAPDARKGPVLEERCERDLNLNLAVLFGRV